MWWALTGSPPKSHSLRAGSDPNTMVDQTAGVTVACVQTDPVIGDLEHNIEESITGIRQAAEAGARVVVLPECASAGWAFEDANEVRQTAQRANDGPTLEAWAQEARRLDLLICGGFSELGADGQVYNSSALIGRDGIIGVYRKVHLWNREKQLFAPGKLGFPVFETEVGHVGMVICYDMWVPESTRSCALGGADLILAPSDWVANPNRPGDALPELSTVMCMASAHSNQCFVAACSRVGTERGQEFIGGSVIVGPHGWPVAGPGVAQPGIAAVACIDPVGSRAERRNDPFNRPLWDREPEQYRVRMAGPHQNEGVSS